MNPCIVVPFRNRHRHLQQFLPHYRKLLPNAQFVIVEQSMEKEFNAFKLANIGCKYAWGQAEYFCFHDVDMIVQGSPDYSYPESPTHCATHASQFGWKLPFESYIGGVILFNKPDLLKVNGYSNNFNCWAGGDTELWYRIHKVGLTVTRRPHRYLSLPHPKRHPTGFDPVRQRQAEQDRAPDDGLNNLTFDVIGEREIQNGRIITVEI
jgi:predicted glycosyltransferase involved in capsule biosynthesis